MTKLLVFSIILFCATNIGLAQNKKTVVVNTELHPNGELKKYSKLTTTRSKNSDVYDFYWKKKREVAVYDSLGNKQYSMTRITHDGTYGRACYEIKYEFKMYDTQNLVWHLDSECDCKRQTYKEYMKGKLMVREKKRRYFWDIVRNGDE